MVYMGSKNRLSKQLVPIIQGYINENTNGYLEPFVGGANVIDKIQHSNRIGCDIHKPLIELLKVVKDNIDKLPKTFTESHYNVVKSHKSDYPDWYLGLIGFCGGYGGQYFDTFARSFKNDKVTPRDMPNERINNLKKQANNFKNIKFICCDFLNIPINKIKGYVIYCDIPYKNTSQYKTSEFPYEIFYKWCEVASKDNTVLVSEYDMPDTFECIWQKEHQTLIASNKKSKDNNNNRTEKLFIYKGEKDE